MGKSDNNTASKSTDREANRRNVLQADGSLAGLTLLRTQSANEDQNPQVHFIESVVLYDGFSNELPAGVSDDFFRYTVIPEKKLEFTEEAKEETIEAAVQNRVLQRTLNGFITGGNPETEKFTSEVKTLPRDTGRNITVTNFSRVEEPETTPKYTVVTSNESTFIQYQDDRIKVAPGNKKEVGSDSIEKDITIPGDTFREVEDPRNPDEITKRRVGDETKTVELTPTIVAKNNGIVNIKNP